MAKTKIDELAVIISANSDGLPADLSKAERDFLRFARNIGNKIAPSVKPPDVSAFKSAGKEYAGLRATARSAAADIAGFAGKAAVVGGTFLAMEAGISSVSSVFQQAKEAVNMAAELEQTRLGFEVMLGSAQQASRVLADVRQYAASTPFNNRDLTDATKQLIAYGRSADVVMDDLRMLGDVSAAFGKRLPIGDLTYLYGTLYAQQRAFTKDLYQFAGRGIPIWRELAAVTGKSGMELRDMVEDGVIGFAEIEQAFQRMTSAGGQFYNMTARQGQTTAGVIEQMSDAFDMLKSDIGGVLIEELGIKDGARDLEKFAGNLRKNVDELRPAVKLAGEFARAGAQIGYEFSTAGLQIAKINLNAFSEALPGAKEFQKILKDAAEFKIDRREIIRGAYLSGVGVSEVVAETGRQIGNFGEGMVGLFEWVVRSAREARDYMRDTAGWLNAINDKAVTKILLAPVAGPMLGAGMLAGLVRDAGNALAHPEPPLGRREGDPIDLARLGPPLPRQGADRIRAEYDAASDNILAAQDRVRQLDLSFAGGANVAREMAEAQRWLGDAHRLRASMEVGYAVPPAEAGRHLRAGNVPPLAGTVPPQNDFLSQLETGLRNARGVFEALGRSDAAAARNNLKRITDGLLASEDVREATEAARQFNGEMRTMRLIFGDPLAAAVGARAMNIPAPENATANSMATWSGALGGPLGLYKVAPPPIPPDIDALRSDLRRRYEPQHELDAYRRQLDQIDSRGLLGPNSRAFTDRAWMEKLQETAGRLGIDQQVHLPSAVEVGSTEDARMVTAWQSQGNDQRDPASLLQMIREAIERQTAAQGRLARDIGREIYPNGRVVVKFPGE